MIYSKLNCNFKNVLRATRLYIELRENHLSYNLTLDRHTTNDMAITSAHAKISKYHGGFRLAIQCASIAVNKQSIYEICTNMVVVIFDQNGISISDLKYKIENISLKEIGFAFNK